MYLSVLLHHNRTMQPWWFILFILKMRYSVSWRGSRYAVVFKCLHHSRTMQPWQFILFILKMRYSVSWRGISFTYLSLIVPLFCMLTVLC
ncbi:hypothetical protein Hdeb2414_s0089g00787151 [Helianthus debilis subsp. tardiflorus]